MSSRFNLKITLLLCGYLCLPHLYAQTADLQKPVAQLVADSKINNAFSKVEMFNPYLPSAERVSQTNAFATDITFAKLDAGVILSLYQDKKKTVTLAVPFKDDVLEMELVQVNILAKDFKVSSSAGMEDYTPGVYYRGIIKGDPNSLVAISVFENEIYGVASNNLDGNINIGRDKSAGAAENDYMIFSDKDILVDNESAGCATPDPEGYESTFHDIMQGGGSTRIDKCPKVYLEADYDLYLNKGSVTATSDYLTSIFNNSAAIYANESVPVEISEIFVWNTNDGYSSASSYSALTAFKANRTTFNGDIAHLIALDPGGLGGVANTINGLCNSYSYCYSDVNSTYSDFPTYSWTIMVITHEMGHLFGSYHTHSCTWVGGAIDNCYTTEGGCAAGPAPVGGGTIMSYCHLTAYGINFSNGFGSQPGDAIRNTISAAACVEAATGGTPTYCGSLGSNSSYEWLQSINVNGMSNASGNNSGYADFTSAATIPLTIGESISFTLTPGYAATAYPEYFSIWVDYNNDQDFNDAGENVYNSGAVTAAVSGTFTIPATAIGTTRMRITMKYNALATPCEIFSYGEVEDYTVAFATPAADYCNASGLSTANEWIDYVQINSFTRSSASDGGYYDGTANVIDLTPGSSYLIKYSTGFSGSPVAEYYKAWIDYNQDGDFDDSGEEIFTRKSKSSNYLKYTITVPVTASAGETRFRIAMKNGSYPTACETFANGEVEDYTINILPGLPAEQLIGESNLSIFPNPNNGTFQISLPDFTADMMYIHICDLAGRLIAAYTETNSDGMAKINANDLAAGLYIIRIGDGTHWLATSEFIKN